MNNYFMYLFLVVSTEIAFCLGISKDSIQSSEQLLHPGTNSDVQGPHSSLVKRSPAFKRLPGWSVYYGKRSADYQNDSHDPIDSEGDGILKNTEGELYDSENDRENQLNDILDYETWLKHHAIDSEGDDVLSKHLDTKRMQSWISGYGKRDDELLNNYLDKGEGASKGEKEVSDEEANEGNDSGLNDGYDKRSPAWFSSGYGKRSPAWFSSGYGKRSPAWFSSGYGKRSPAWFSSGYGKRSPAWFSSGYGKRSPAWFTSGYGKRSPAWFSSGYGKRSPAWFGSGYGKRSPAWFSSGYGKRSPAWFGSGYGKRPAAWMTGYGKRSPAWFSGYGKRSPAWFSGYGKRSPGEIESDDNESNALRDSEIENIIKEIKDGHEKQASDWSSDDKAPQTWSNVYQR